MSRRLTIGILVALVGILLAVGGIYLMVRMVRAVFAPLPVPTEEPVAQESVLVASHDLRLGEVLGEDDLNTIQVPVALIPLNAVRNPEDVIGRYTKVDLVTGEMILAHHLADPTNISHDIGYTIADDEVLYAYPAQDLISSLGIIQRGDIIDLFVSLEIAPEQTTEEEAAVAPGEEEQEPQAEMYTFDAMQRISVTATVVDIVPAQNENEPPTTHTVAYLFAMSAQDALLLKHLQDIGADMEFVLRSPTSRTIFEVTPINEQYLLDRFQLTPAEIR